MRSGFPRRLLERVVEKQPMSQQDKPLSRRQNPIVNGLLPETSPGKPQPEKAATEPDLTGAEWRLVEIAVGHVLRSQEWPLREYLRDDARQIGAVAIFLLRPRLAQLTKAERAPYAVTSLCRELYRWLTHELAQRQQVDPVQPAGREDQPPLEPADERETNWDHRIARNLLEDIRDERLALALRALPPLTQQILNLYYFGDLPDRAIAVCLHAPVKTVQSLRRRTIKKLQGRLGMEEVKAAS